MHRHPRLHARLDKQRLRIEIPLANLPQHRIERRHHRRNHDPVNPLRLQAGHGKQIAKEHAVFVHRTGLHGGDAPVGDQPVVAFSTLLFSVRMYLGHAGEDSQHRIGIADIKNKKHDRDLTDC